MRIWSVLPAIFGLMVLAIARPAHGAPTLCKKTEINYFSCKAGAQIISLCASRDLSSTSGYMQFRYGRKGNIEQIFPKEKKHPKGLFSNTHENYTDGVEFGLHFNVGDVTYTVYNTITFPGSNRDQANRHGLRITKGDAFMKETECVPSNPEEVFHFDLDSEFFK